MDDVNDGRFKIGTSGNPATQFKKGQSGNLSGKPKGTRNRQTIVRELLDAIHEESGKSNADAITAALVRKALDGDVPAFKELMDSSFGKIKEELETTHKFAKMGEVSVNRDGEQQQITDQSDVVEGISFEVGADAPEVKEEDEDYN